MKQTKFRVFWICRENPGISRYVSPAPTAGAVSRSERRIFLKSPSSNFKMPEKSNFKLTESEILQVAEAILQDPRPEVRQRAIAIQMLAIGERLPAVARRMAVHPFTVRQWYHRFRQVGYEGLATQPRGRPKRKADRAYCQALEEALERHPGEFGYKFASWSVERLRDHLEKVTGTHLSCSRLRMVMRNNRFEIRFRERSAGRLQMDR